MSQHTDVVQSSEWRELFDHLSKEYAGDEVTIEVVSNDFGDDYEAERMPLGYLEYDPNVDVFIVGVGGLDGRYPVMLRHFVEHPKSIAIDAEGPEGTLAVEVIGADDFHTLVTVRPTNAERGREIEGARARRHRTIGKVPND